MASNKCASRPAPRLSRPCHGMSSLSDWERWSRIVSRDELNEGVLVQIVAGAC